jgi:hypothetical protein
MYIFIRILFVSCYIYFSLILFIFWFIGAHGGAVGWGTTNHKVAGSIPDGVFGIFHLYNPSVRTVALGSTQHLTETSARDILWG